MGQMKHWMMEEYEKEQALLRGLCLRCSCRYDIGRSTGPEVEGFCDPCEETMEAL